MSKYAENNLRSGETILLKAKINPLAAVRSFVFCLVFVVGGILLKVLAFGKLGEESLDKVGTIIMLVMIAIGVIILLYRILYLSSMTLAATDKRVIGKVGIIKKNVLDYPIEKVDNVSLKSSFFGSIFRYSSVCVQGASSEAAIVFVGISNANQFKNAVTDAIEKHQEDARRAQAQEIAMAMRGGNNN